MNNFTENDLNLVELNGTLSDSSINGTIDNSEISADVKSEETFTGSIETVTVVGSLNYFKGEKGDKGDIGEKGEKGDKGDTGDSAYEEWLKQEGNEGKTYDDFLDYLRGGIEVNSDYIREEPVKVAIGNVKVGTTFKGTIQDALDMLFYPLIDSKISLTVSPSGNMENGTVVSNSVLRVNITKNSGVLNTISFYKNNNLLDTINCTNETTYQFSDAVGYSSNVTYRATLNYSLGEETKTVSASSTINFMNKVYWGTKAEQEMIDSSFILNLQNNVLSTTKARTISTNLINDEYFYYALPSSLGTPIFTVGGFEGGFVNIASLEFTNSSGYTTSYNVWRTEHNNLGSMTIVIS